MIYHPQLEFIKNKNKYIVVYVNFNSLPSPKPPVSINKYHIHIVIKNIYQNAHRTKL